MANLFAILAGCVAGLFVGFFVGWLFVDFGWIPNTIVWRGIMGGVSGGIFGGIAGSISGDMNRRGDTGTHRFLIALFCGTVFGILGGTKMTVLGRLLEQVNIQSPFN